MRKNFRGRKLIVGFGAFLSLTLLIGIIGIFQIHSLSAVIKKLGQHYLPRERAVLEMKRCNALYVMGIRHYAFWRTSKYLESAAVASNISLIEQSFQEFKSYLKQYRDISLSEQQKLWAEKINKSSDELYALGGKIVNLSDKEEPDKEQINKFLMIFESQFYDIDGLLRETLSKNNLEDIERQLSLTQRKKETSELVLTISLIFSILLGISISFFEYGSLKEDRQKREMLVRRMIGVEEEERKNLSRQIHDQLGQELSALKIYLDLIEKDSAGENGEQKKRIKQSKEILSGLIDRSHNISELLRPPELDYLGLQGSIEVLISEHRNITGYKYIYNKPASEIKLGAEESLELYRLAQEALTNSTKHSRAKNVEVTLDKRGNNVYLCIRDDGVGFDYDEYLKLPRRRVEDKLKLGLRGLHERMELLGGVLTIKTAPGKGTKIEAEL